MTYTEDSGLPLDDVRDLIGDISNDSDKEYLSDDEIDKEISRAGNNVFIASARCCAKIAARYAPFTDFTIGRKSKSKSQIFQHFKQLENDLRTEAKRSTFAGMTVPSIGKVADAQTYPDRFVHGEEQPVDWSVDEEDL